MHVQLPSTVQVNGQGNDQLDVQIPINLTLQLGKPSFFQAFTAPQFSFDLLNFLPLWSRKTAIIFKTEEGR